MTKKAKIIVLSVTLATCILVLGTLIGVFFLGECKHHFCRTRTHEPTCEVKGYTFYECLSCDYTFEADFVAPLGHQFIDVVTDPLCDAEGYTTHTCSECGVVNIDTYISPKGHDFEKTVIEPTCEGQGYTKQVCSDCDFSKNTDYIKPLGHDLTGEKTDPTCLLEGFYTFSCSRCTHKYVSDYIEPSGHSVKKISTTNPTCLAEGYSTYKCENCEYSYNSDYTDPIEHSVEKISTTASKCLREGYSIYGCVNCDYEYKSDYTSPVGHTVSKAITLAPTCEEIGYSIYECVNCDYEYFSDYVDPTGHNSIKTDTLAPTCTSEGYSTYECENCEFTYFGDFTTPLGHILSQYTVAPTCTSEGYTTYSCANCSYIYTSDKLAPTEHRYEKTYVRPNIEQTGYTIYTCTVCGSESIADYVFYSDIFSGAKGEGSGALAFGLDLSHHSYDVDFAALKAAGVDYVILRVGYNTELDTRFEEYYAAACEAGLDIGVYFFTLATNKDEAKSDALRVANWLEGKKLEYPVFYDIEDYASYQPSTFSETQIMEIAHTFMTTMVDNGYYPGLYTNNNFLYNVFNNEKTLRLYDVWYARYTDATDERLIEYSGLYSMWQYDGNVEGYENGAVEGMCDLNYTFKNYPEIIKKFGFNGY